MSATDGIAASSDETRPLLDNYDTESTLQRHDNHSDNRGPRIGIDLAVHLHLVIRESLGPGACLYLIFVPVGIIIGALRLNSVAISILNLIATIPLCALISHSSDVLSDLLGKLIGGLISATFGNTVEIIVGVLAMNHGEIQFAQTMMIGSILSDILLILGCCIISACHGKTTIELNSANAETLSSLMTITAVALILPTALYSTLNSARNSGVFERVLTFSRASAGVLLIFYLLYLYFQLRTHSHLFEETKEDEEPTEEPETTSNVNMGETTSNVNMGETTSDINMGETNSTLHILSAVIILLLATAGVVACTHFLIDNIDETAKTLHITKRFIAAIILPIASNATELSTVISTARNGRTDFAVVVIVGSILQIALFVTPLLVILGWIINQPMTLYFEIFQTTFLFFSVLMVNRILKDVQYTYLHGFMLIELYAIGIVIFFIRPESKLKIGMDQIL